MKQAIIAKTLLASLGFFTLFAPSQASAQLIPQPWVSVGSNEGDITYAVGARAFGLGVEVGNGPDGATGVDVLKFVNLPVISPYVGLGLYSHCISKLLSATEITHSKAQFIGFGSTTFDFNEIPILSKFVITQ